MHKTQCTVCFRFDVCSKLNLRPVQLIAYSGCCQLNPLHFSVIGGSRGGGANRNKTTPWCGGLLYRNQVGSRAIRYDLKSFRVHRVGLGLLARALRGSRGSLKGMSSSPRVSRGWWHRPCVLRSEHLSPARLLSGIPSLPFQSSRASCARTPLEAQYNSESSRH